MAVTPDLANRRRELAIDRHHKSAVVRFPVFASVAKQPSVIASKVQQSLIHVRSSSPLRNRYFGLIKKRYSTPVFANVANHSLIHVRSSSPLRNRYFGLVKKRYSTPVFANVASHSPIHVRSNSPLRRHNCGLAMERQSTPVFGTIVIRILYYGRRNNLSRYGFASNRFKQGESQYRRLLASPQ